MKLLYIVDPLDRLVLAGDTSYALMLETARRGWEVWTCLVEDLGLVGDDAVCEAMPTQVVLAETPADAFRVGGRESMRLGDFDVVCMRKDPPLDVNYLHATWILDHARGKTLLVNDPRGLRELNEHLAVLRFPALTPPTIVMPGLTPKEAFQIEAPQPQRLGDFDIVLMRKDPPLDVNYLHATWILDHARGKTLLVNDPRGLRELNEHLAVLAFPHLTPATIVTRSTEKLRAFQAEQGGAIVVKPVDGYGGLGIFVVKDGDPNASSILETSTGAGTRWTLAQTYLPKAVEGDKRIILVDGESVGAVLRVPATRTSDAPRSSCSAFAKAAASKVSYSAAMFSRSLLVTRSSGVRAGALRAAPSSNRSLPLSSARTTRRISF